eukprot:TRINITY_DN93076_c0_g1_i1.p1 TRINITY_DN93076_c0_g1~~TRINITY_DN93076_c0_g1_i1.p1  ORF type:complete len:695 (+),score=140.80 TRINITY_DN93076_c0_g1_i1:28-2085(+)
MADAGEITPALEVAAEAEPEPPSNGSLHYEPEVAVVQPVEPVEAPAQHQADLGGAGQLSVPAFPIGSRVEWTQQHARGKSDVCTGYVSAVRAASATAQPVYTVEYFTDDGQEANCNLTTDELRLVPLAASPPPQPQATTAAEIPETPPRPAPATAPEPVSGGKESSVLASGHGDIEHDISEDALREWSDVIVRWPEISKKGKTMMAARGVPDKLRYQVWTLLTEEHIGRPLQDMTENYRLLVTRPSATERIIFGDINRTFPVHDFFREEGGEGQQRLYRVAKAYSVYDQGIGYVQGLSFIIAELLIHMPEEDAFSLVVHMMFHYGLRELFAPEMVGLKLMLYQLDRLLAEAVPDLHAHLAEQGVTTEMYASQWFLTLFAAKFSLNLSFRVLDLFFAIGQESLLAVALAMLRRNRQELLACRFEEALTVIRVGLPRQFVEVAWCEDLIADALKEDVSERKLKRLEEDYAVQRQQMDRELGPYPRLMQQVQELRATNTRLEEHNSYLSRQMGDLQRDLSKALIVNEEHKNTVAKQIQEMWGERSATSDTIAKLEQELSRSTEILRATQKERDVARKELETYRNDVSGRLQAAEEELSVLRKQQASNGAELAQYRESLTGYKDMSREELECALAFAKKQIFDLEDENAELRAKGGASAQPPAASSMSPLAALRQAGSGIFRSKSESAR